MAELNRQVLQEQLAAAAARIIAFERHKNGYQGPIEVDDVDIVVRVKCGDGRRRRVEPSEITDGTPSTFVRDFVLLGDRPGMNVVAFLEKFLPVVSPKAAGFFSALKGWLGMILALALLAGAAFAQAPALVLDHDMLVSLARTKEPEVRFSYTPERVEIRTRRSALVGWIDVLLTARFERCNGHVQLVAQSLRAGPLGDQRGKRFEEARAGLRKLVNVKTAATRVEIYRAGELVYSQVLEPAVRE